MLITWFTQAVFVAPDAEACCVIDAVEVAV
jgi:hypothetical protein